MKELYARAAAPRTIIALTNHTIGNNPKNEESMKQIYNILSIAALVLAGALTTGCVDQLTEPLQQEESGTVTLTATVGFDASTKALTAEGVKTFAVDDEIAVIYTQKEGASTKTVKAVTAQLKSTDIFDGGKKATISVTLTEPVAGTVSYVYPASMVVDDATLATLATDAAGIVNTAALAAQEGTLAKLSSNLDCGVGSGTMTEDAGTFTLPGGVTLSNQFAILELTAKNFAGSATLDALTSLMVSDGTNTYTVTPASPATILSLPIYVAMQPVTADKTISFTATDGTTNYWKTLTGQALAKNNLYPANVRMFRLITITPSTGELTLVNGDAITGTGGTETHVTIADGATVTLRDVDITAIPNLSDHYWAGITCEGDATILLCGTNTVKPGPDALPGIFVQKVGDVRKTLTIDGDGSLTATSYNGAGIGGRCYADGGNVIINGGTITATSTNGAGIGGGNHANFGTITINGGTVTASSTNDTQSGAGIGSGCIDLSGYSRTIGDITITGGDVTAISYAYGAGIGTGYCIDGTVTGGNILISGGTVTANSLQGGAAAIGSGAAGDNGNTNTCGTVTIGSGVTSVAVGIYTGLSYSDNFVGAGNNATCGTVTIDGHVMTADEMHDIANCTASDFPILQWSGPASVTNPVDPADSNWNLTVWTLTKK
jgi:hypothetical protein